MQFKKRTVTKFVCVVKKDCKGLTLSDLYKEARRRGEFDTGYHLYLHHSGVIEKDRDETSIAGWHLKDCNESLYILADTPDSKLSDSQRIMLRSIVQKYPESEVIEVE